VRSRAGNLGSQCANFRDKTVTRIRNASCWCLVVAVSATLVAGMGANARTGSQTTQEPANSEKQQTLIRSVEGVDLYRAYCASCHGKDGKGNGQIGRAHV
jgi:cytochrome c5